MAPREKFTTIYSGMEVEPFLESGRHRDRVRAELGYGPQDIVVGKVARLFHLKGHEDVIQAAATVVAEQPNVRFLFVGDGILAERLEARSPTLGLTGHFHFTGLVPPDRVPALVAAMDIVVHASLREGLARVLPQALIAGRPWSATTSMGPGRWSCPGQTGYLVPPRDVARLGRAIIELAADPALRQRLGSEGRRRFTDVFRHERMTAQLRELYQRLLEEGLGTRG